jgi:hypothetical protein
MAIEERGVGRFYQSHKIERGEKLGQCDGLERTRVAVGVVDGASRDLITSVAKDGAGSPFGF